ncbi:hypothetical protein BH23ACT5_BH23ACT5_12340 [soil metagenome]
MNDGRSRVGSLLLVGAVAGFLSGMLGVGGGIIMVPLLVGVLGFDQHRAHASSLAAIVLIAISAAVRFGAAGEVVWSVGLALGVGGVVGSTLGAHLMHRLSPDTLKLVFGVILVLAGARLALGGDEATGEVASMVVSVVVGILIGLVAGIASGIAGIGGGVLMVPAMVLLLGMPQHAAEGTSLVAILFTAVAGTRVHLANRRVDLKQAAIIGLGGVLSAQLGAALALDLSATSLSRVFGVFVILIGGGDLIRLARKRQARGSVS